MAKSPFSSSHLSFGEQSHTFCATDFDFASRSLLIDYYIVARHRLTHLMMIIGVTMSRETSNFLLFLSYTIATPFPVTKTNKKGKQITRRSKIKQIPI